MSLNEHERRCKGICSRIESSEIYLATYFNTCVYIINWYNLGDFHEKWWFIVSCGDLNKPRLFSDSDLSKARMNL